MSAGRGGRRAAPSGGGAPARFPSFISSISFSSFSSRPLAAAGGAGGGWGWRRRRGAQGAGRRRGGGSAPWEGYRNSSFCCGKKRAPPKTNKPNNLKFSFSNWCGFRQTVLGIWDLITVIDSPTVATPVLSIGAEGAGDNDSCLLKVQEAMSQVAVKDVLHLSFCPVSFKNYWT